MHTRIKSALLLAVAAACPFMLDACVVRAALIVRVGEARVDEAI